MRHNTADETMNCLQCCLASMFSMPLASVPTVHKWAKDDAQNYWFNGFHNWSSEILGYTPVSIVDDTLDGLFHIAVIQEKKGYFHAVVARGTEVIMDPHPDPSKRAKNLLDVDNWEYSLLFIKSKGKCLQRKLEEDYETGTDGQSGKQAVDS